MRTKLGNEFIIVPISTLTIDPKIQPRAAVDPSVIADYAEAMIAGDKFPPIIVFHDGKRRFVADGFQRVEAARQAKLREVSADVRKGTRRDAILFACGCNAYHGARRTNDDKRAVVLRLLNDPEWTDWNDREIARRCAVSGPFVATMRDSGNFKRLQMRKVIRGGKTYTMDTANIGAKATPATIPPPPAVDRDPDLQFGLHRITKRGMCSCGKRNCKKSKPLNRPSFIDNPGIGCSDGDRVLSITKQLAAALGLCQCGKSDCKKCRMLGYESLSRGMSRGVVSLGLDVAEKLAAMLEQERN